MVDLDMEGKEPLETEKIRWTTIDLTMEDVFRVV